MTAMRRAFSVSPRNEIVEVFSDGTVDLITRPHPGFAIARIVGPRGERPGSFVVLRWTETWAEQVRVQSGTAEYLAHRPPIILPPLSVLLQRRDSFPGFCWAAPEQKAIGQSFSAAKVADKDPAPDNCAARIGKMEFRGFELEDIDETAEELSGEIEDLVAALRATTKYENEEELLITAQAIVASRKNRTPRPVRVMTT